MKKLLITFTLLSSLLFVFSCKKNFNFKSKEEILSQFDTFYVDFSFNGQDLSIYKNESYSYLTIDNKNALYDLSNFKQYTIDEASSLKILDNGYDYSIVNKTFEYLLLFHINNVDSNYKVKGDVNLNNESLTLYSKYDKKQKATYNVYVSKNTNGCYKFTIDYANDESISCYINNICFDKQLVNDKINKVVNYAIGNSFKYHYDFATLQEISSKLNNVSVEYCTNSSSIKYVNNSNYSYVYAYGKEYLLDKSRETTYLIYSATKTKKVLTNNTTIFDDIHSLVLDSLSAHLSISDSDYEKDSSIYNMSGYACNKYSINTILDDYEYNESFYVSNGLFTIKRTISKGDINTNLEFKRINTNEEIVASELSNYTNFTTVSDTSVFYHYDFLDKNTVMSNLDNVWMIYEVVGNKIEVINNDKYMYFRNEYVSYFIDKVSKSSYSISNVENCKITIDYNEMNETKVLGLLQDLFTSHYEISDSNFIKKDVKDKVTNINCDVYEYISSGVSFDSGMENIEKVEQYYVDENTGKCLRYCATLSNKPGEYIIDNKLVKLDYEQEFIDGMLEYYNSLEVKTSQDYYQYTSWPMISLTKYLPELTVGSFIVASSNGVKCNITYSGLSVKQVTDYYNQLGFLKYTLVKEFENIASIHHFVLYRDNILVTMKYYNNLLTISIEDCSSGVISDIIDSYIKANE